MGTRILVVEDTPHNLELMRYLLEAHGHDVVPAETGERALARARIAPPALVIMDLQLAGGMNGYQTLDHLRLDPRLADVPVIAVTAFAMVGDRDQALAAGFDGYLTKPIEPETFAREIDGYQPPGLRGSTPAVLTMLTETADQRRPNGPDKATILVVDDSAVNLSLLRSVLEPH